MRSVFNRRTRFAEKKLSPVLKNLKVAVVNAKNEWLKIVCDASNYTFGTKNAWDNVKLL